MKQFTTFFSALALLPILLTGCGNNEASARAEAEKETFGGVVASLPPAETNTPVLAQVPTSTPEPVQAQADNAVSTEAPTNTPEPVQAEADNAAPAEAPTPLPQEPVVTQLSGYLEAGSFHIVGLLLNNTDTVITDVELALVAKDAQSETLLT